VVALLPIDYPPPWRGTEIAGYGNGSERGTVDRGLFDIVSHAFPACLGIVRIAGRNAAANAGTQSKAIQQ